MIDDLDNEPNTITFQWADVPTMGTFPKCYLCVDQIDATYGPNYVTVTPFQKAGLAFHSTCFSNFINAANNFKHIFIDDPNYSDNPNPIIH